MTKIKVAYLISTLDTGGAERQLVNTLNSIDTKKFEVKVFVLKDKTEIKNQINSNISIYVINIGSYANPTSILKTIKTIKQYNPQLLHSVMYASNLIARMYKITNKKTKVINHVHGIGSWIKKRHIFIDRLLLPFVDKIIVVSNKSKQIRLTREKYPENKVEVIYNSIESKDYVFKERSYPTATIKLGTASRLVSLKQIDLGIQIINEVKKLGLDIQFLIAGSGPEEEGLKKIVEDLNLNDTIIFHGHITNMPDFYKQINCFAIFSRTEDMPLSIVEAFASGIPSIAPNVGGISELFEKNISLLIDTNKGINLISEKITTFLKECDFEKAQVINQKYAVEIFDNIQHKKKIEELYFRLLKND
ncbi:MAG: glycosyltransferase involved in cell wall biosynthesis [Polaribacter sp.]|jgi:glycosyltransferase involved in cell wall biosynthesis|tara:strand:+ start:4328 stop:5413 length:1086 start_codon:yes stop_codon:yes gene_type:complete